jgi:DNA-binding beta-propeller fold protein YncE
MNTRRLDLVAWIFAFIGCLLSSAARAQAIEFGPPVVLSQSFSVPSGLGIDSLNGRLLVADTANHRIRYATISALGGAPTWSEFGFTPSRSDAAALNEPQGVAADGAGNVFVVNTFANDVQLYRWNAGTNTYDFDSTFASTTRTSVAGLAINRPRDIAVASDGKIYLLDSGNHRILVAASASANAWTVWRTDATWGNPYGLDVANDGTVYVADTDHHRIVKIPPSGSPISFGSYGTGSAQFRAPRDVAVAADGKLFVADSENHRVVILRPNGTQYETLGGAPLFSAPQKVVIDSAGRIFVVDSNLNCVVAFLGTSVGQPFDLYERDYVGDDGIQPSSSSFVLSSPDVLVRHQADVNLAAAAASGLESIAFEEPLYDRTNYVYVAVHNRGTHIASGSTARLYWADPGSALAFPADWKATGFYSNYTNATTSTPSNSLAIPTVAARASGADGVVVVGPILWRPPAPESMLAADGKVDLFVRVLNAADRTATATGLAQVRVNNNVAMRPTKVSRGPFPFGNQNTLIVRVNYPDIPTESDPNTVQLRATELANWIKEVSWDQATVTVLQRGAITLPHNKGYYDDHSNSRLIEMTQDALDILLGAEPALLDGTGSGHEIERVVLVTNDLNDTRDWATTGSWPYMVNGQQRYLTVSVQGGNNSTPMFSHGMSHQLNMVDLYAYDNVTFPRPYVDGWDNMAKPINGAHPLVWGKEISGWPSSRNAKILFVPRPDPGATWNNNGNPIPLYYQETAAAGQTIAVAFGLTNGVTSFNEESAFYYVEARRNSGPGTGFDSILPQNGVLMYYANSTIPQGQGPVILRDHVPGGDLTDAAIPIGGTEAPAGTGIQVTVMPGTGGADYSLAVQYNPPATDYDVYMHPGSPQWESPDIWADNQSNGYAGQPSDTGEQPIAGEENRIYAHVFNHGPATAYDVEVAWQFSEPYHTVGNEASFQDYMSKFIDQLDANSDAVTFVPWTPRTGIDPHTCARVQVRRLFNDTNSTNNNAQKNFEVDHSEHGSPYSQVDFPFQVVNGEKDPHLFYFRADGVPKDWIWSISPPKVFLQAGEMGSGVLTLQPPPSAPDCSSHRVFVTGWMPRGDTLIRLGGTTVNVDLQRKAQIDLKASLQECKQGDQKLESGSGPDSERPEHSWTSEPLGAADGTADNASSKRVPALSLEEDKALADAIKYLADDARATDRAEKAAAADRKCLRIKVNGCINPKIPNQDIVVRYESPDGKPVYHTVHTDANGCYEDFNVATEGGPWTTTVELPGNKCVGPANADGNFDVPLSPVEHPEGNLPDSANQICVASFSSNVEGVIERASEEATKAECEVGAIGEAVKLKLAPNSKTQKDAVQFAGEIEIINLRQLLTLPVASGLEYGRFHWSDGSMEAVGTVSGIVGVGTHEKPLCPHCGETANEANHWELSLDGVIVKGPSRGTRLRAVLALNVAASATDAGRVHLKLVGSMEGVLEEGCDLSSAGKEQRVSRAIAEYGKPPLSACGEALPCLGRISKQGLGKIVLDQTRHERCSDGKCGSFESWSRLAVPLKSEVTVEGAAPFLADGVLVVPEFVDILDRSNSRGEHAGKFVYVADNGVRVSGEMMGISNAGAHRDPLVEDYEAFDVAGHLEGKLTGRILNGQNKGLLVEARYAMTLPTTNQRTHSVIMSVQGWAVRKCLQAP